MKKSLFALAALSAVAGAAQAQSSVTVYGILDVGFASTSSRNGTTKMITNMFDQSRETSSRLGFKGTEDLGGGLSAFFTAETGLNPNANTFSSMDNRQTFVGLAKKGAGAASIGTQYTVLHNEFTQIDPGMSNNNAGSVLRPSGANTNTNVEAGQYTSSTAYVIESTNMIIANSESFAGFRGNAMYVQNGANKTITPVSTASTTGGQTNYTGWGLSGDYTWNKLYATAAYQSFKQVQNVNGVSGQAAAVLKPDTQNTLGSSSNNTDNQFLVGASYDFGILKAYAGYISRKLTSTYNSNDYVKRTAQQIGVRSYITPTIESWASIGNGRYSGTATGSVANSSAPTANFNAWQLGTNYYLSKRTNLYGIYGQSLTSSTSINNYAGAATSQFSLGVRHTF